MFIIVKYYCLYYRVNIFSDTNKVWVGADVNYDVGYVLFGIVDVI